MSTNQEGKHTPEQILEREAGEIFPLHSYPGNSIEGGKLYKQLQKAYIAGGHSILASQSSELSKLREENERLNLYYAGVLRHALDGLSGSIDQAETNLEKTTERLHEMQQLYKDLSSCFGTIAALESKGQHSLTEREQEVERLRDRLEMSNLALNEWLTEERNARVVPEGSEFHSNRMKAIENTMAKNRAVLDKPNK